MAEDRIIPDDDDESDENEDDGMYEQKKSFKPILFLCGLK